MFYGQGYFRQRLDRAGWQQEEYIQTDVNQLPMEPAIGERRAGHRSDRNRSGTIQPKFGA